MKQTKTHTTSRAAHANIEVVYQGDAFKSDVKNSALLVSVLVNMTFLIAYMLLQITSAYDYQVISLLLTR